MSDTATTCIAGKGASDTDTRMVIPACEVESGDLMNFSFCDPHWLPVEAITRREAILSFSQREDIVGFKVAGKWHERGAGNPLHIRRPQAIPA